MKFDIRKIVLMALYIALFAILSFYGTINFHELKITLQNIPIYIASITLGMIPGAIVGFAGMFIHQLLAYGFTATTLLWVLPQTILGALAGYLFEKRIVRMDQTNRFAVTILLLQLMLTLLNTIIYTLDSLLYGYFNYLLIFGPIVIKLMLSIITGVVYFVVIPIIVNVEKKIH